MANSSLKILIEVCVDSVESALAAVRGGADRLELCGHLGLGGGTTPSAGLLKAVQNAVPNTPIMVMVRPRCGDFLYSSLELEVMIEDIRNFRQLGVSGVVFGVLTCGGRVDVERTKQLVAEALPMQVCFHRAFDMTVDYTEALFDISTIPGVSRILTSGHGKSVVVADALSTILHYANLRAVPSRLPRSINILAGSGVNPVTVRHVLRPHHLQFGLRDIHLTGGRWIEGDMWHRPEDMGMGVIGQEWSVWRTSEAAIREVRSLADSLFAKWVAEEGRQ